VIRFSCPHCGRAYVLADALAHLPLLCKGCGQRLNVPDPSPEPEPVLPPPPVKKPPAPRPAAPAPTPGLRPGLAKPESAKSEPAKAAAPPASEPPGDMVNRLATKSRESPELNSEGLFETPANADLLAEPPAPPAAKKPVAPPPAPPAPPRAGRKLLPVVVDVLVVLVLVGLGVLAGELLVKKSSGQILSESSSAPKFPPVELLMWLAGPVLAGLIYLWLGTRGWTVGGWLKRRAAA